MINFHISKYISLLGVILIILTSLETVRAQQIDLVIKGATIIDGTGAPPKEQMHVLISEGRIKEIVPNNYTSIPDSAKTINAKGKYLLPGFSDMHVHFGSGGYESEVTPIDRILHQFLFYGVTSVFSLGGTGGSTQSIIALREKIRSGNLISPHIYATGNMLTLPGSHPIATGMSLPPGADSSTYDWSERGVAVVKNIEEAKIAVKDNAEAGMDGIKIVVESGPLPYGDDHPQMPPKMIEAIVNEADSLGLSVYAHVSSLDEIEDAVEAKVHGIMHFTVAGAETWREMHEQEIFLVPTLSLYAPTLIDLWNKPESINDSFLKAGVPSYTLKSMKNWEPYKLTDELRHKIWNDLLNSLKAAYEAGVPIALGTDTNNPFVFPGYSVHLELEYLVEAGLTPMEAIVTTTKKAAEMLNKDDDFGTIEPGKRADLLILDGNPIQDIRNTRSIGMVILEGKIINRQSLLKDE